jgi:hypothetical protein
MGPILEEFKSKKEQLIQSAHDLLVKALTQKELPIPAQPIELKITAQGGVGTAEEHAFLLNQYDLDSIGWGSPFLLVPEATAVDQETRDLLAKSKECDFYLSNISPLGVPFNSVKGSSNDYWKQKRINENKAGSSCPKRLLALSKEIDEEGTCTASKKYQDIKLEELDQNKSNLSAIEYQKQKDKITEKACLCVGLVNAAYMENGIEIKGQQQGVIICPGPNLAYFDKEVSLANMVQHIYGKTNILSTENRSNVFINELKMYVDYLKNEVTTFTGERSANQIKKWTAFKNNLLEGVTYYESLFAETPFFKLNNKVILEQLHHYKNTITAIEINNLVLA